VNTATYRRVHPDPATAEELGTVPDMGLEETQLAILSAAEAFKTWGKTTAKERHDILVRFYNLMQENAEDLARIIVSALFVTLSDILTKYSQTLENGKALAEAKVTTHLSALGVV
jgi:succinate-semialdehyde dehydrogenase/glutarate-semialdehyde dehydrogenase